MPKTLIKVDLSESAERAASWATIAGTRISRSWRRSSRAKSFIIEYLDWTGGHSSRTTTPPTMCATSI